MTKINNIKNSVLSAAAALVLASAMVPAAAFADTTLATAESPLNTFTDSIERVIRTDSAKVYAATARAAGNEAEAAAIEAEAASAPEQNVAAPITVERPAASAAPSAGQSQAAPSATAAPAAATVAASPNTIQIGASSIPFVQCYLAPAAPDHTAGLWWGSSSTTDNDLGYFVGHNPGVFAPVVSLTAGDTVTVTDGTGASHTYTVFDVFDVANTTTLEQIQSRICGHGESIAMQACIQGGAFYRVVVAA